MIEAKTNEFLWVQKYRPQKIDDVILPDDIKKRLKSFLKQKNLPNFLFSGSAGVGKTTVAKALLNELGSDSIVINGSLNGNIDTLRNQIREFASSVSFSGGRKYVILDEADYLTPMTQPALRNFLEEFSDNCGFIFTANYANRIISPLRSRCVQIDFNVEKKDHKQLAGNFFKRVLEILDIEGVEYEKKVVAAIVQKYFPDFRKTLNELQQFSSLGKIDSGVLSVINTDNFGELVGFLKQRQFSDMRSWVGKHSNNDSSAIFRKIYDSLYDILSEDSIPFAILILAKYQYQSAHVSDQEINLVACLTEIMAECTFK